MSHRIVASMAAAALGLGSLSTGVLPAQAAPPGEPITAGSTTGPMPDVVPVSGSWTRGEDGGYTAAAGPEENIVAVSEQQVAGTARYLGTVTVDSASPHAVGALLFRASADGATGYAVAVDPNLDRIRLFDVATGEDIVSPSAVPLDAGTAYSVDVHIDGPRIRVLLDGAQLIDATDERYTRGSVGLHAYNGTVRFAEPSIRTLDTALDGWVADATGWAVTSRGLVGAAPPETNIRTVATGQAPTGVDATVDVQVHSAWAVAALLVRANAAGTEGYAVEVDTNADRLRLYRIGDNVTLGTHNAVIDVGQVYRLSVVATGPDLAVHWQTDFLDPDGFEPVITATDSTHSAGHLGVLAYNGTAAFQGLTLMGLQSPLDGWRSGAGEWEPDARGLRGTAPSGEALTYVPATASDVVISLDASVPATAPSSLSVIARTSADGSGGVELRISPASRTLELVDRTAGTVIGSGPVPGHSFASDQLNRLQYTVRGDQASVLVNGTVALEAVVPEGGTGLALAVASGTAYFQNVRADGVGQYMNGLYQPGYHYSQNAGNSSDPNGLVYYEGEYHLFHQDRGRWAHAVSSDLVHWKQLPIALPHLQVGESWSGSAVVDADDASGLFSGGSGLIAFYTSFNHDRENGNQSVRAAYSTDNGRSWKLVQTEPVVENPGGPDGGWDFRDPKVTWDSTANQWVMVVAGGDHIRFYTSTDLLTWQHSSNFGYGDWVRGGVWECPDFFELPVDGDPTRKRWVLWWSTGAVRATDGSSSQYVTGSWDGASFAPDTGSADVLQADYGRDYYAAMSFFGSPDGRRVMLGWMSNWDYAFSPPTGRWNGQLSVPRELALTDVPGKGLRLTQSPVAELESIRSQKWSATGIEVAPGAANPLAGVTGVSYELQAEVALPDGGATGFAFGLREGNGQVTRVVYDAGRVTLDRGAAGAEDFTHYFSAGDSGNASAPWSVRKVGGETRIALRILVDSSSVEVFGGDGTAALTSLVFPDPASSGMSFTAVGGNARLVNASVYELAPTAKLDTATPEAPLPEAGGYARHDLGAFTVVPGGRWESTGAGLSGRFDRDSTALASTEFADVRVEATVRFGSIPFTGAHTASALAPDRGYGGAGSVLLRASADGTQGYFVNVDPNLRVVRVFSMSGGSMTTLAEVPVLVGHGVSYRLGTDVIGDRIRVELDGEQIIDVVHDGPDSGTVGLNVFDGRAAYQDVRISAL